MSILTIVIAGWFFNKGIKLKKTKDIEKYVWGYSKRIKDIDGYIKLYSKLYFSSGLFLIALEIFNILDKYYFKLPMNILIILFCIVFTLIIIGSVVIEKKIKQFTY
ncbi:hypothetical protein [Paraclostridium sordellii]|uniref:SdpI/YhfL family protein n=1 Tax=Paraclostridium sordellii TaxID=1505 RepID=A0A0C7QUB4_PARSO|nr:hypothetical protein [Paeniclostridium sordellii]CEN77462.1 Uncharacterised protein [[Clostridium] sordellii] [Paeniclostridium sordellii]CEO07701.1 Uncharacterised protein [[Clostridium] sordellii] [Paeniclostridium sordellii]CEQ00295.1 Uncharacterised protein [[Clostridium] sordellii] [Paeniclostridium sordellii]CEQ01981.1 Uncharacterised protein [[Clostridium] sordellii] [Paeniclostridium sordellii]